MKDQLNYNERKAWAKALFTSEAKEIPEVAATCNVPENTVRNWVEKEEWRGVKMAMKMTKSNMLELYRIQVGKLSEKIKLDTEVNTKDMDAFVKYTTCIKNLEAEPSVSETIEVFEPFVKWLRRRDSAVARAFVVHMDAYVAHQIAA